MGPGLAPKHATDDLAWAQPWPPRMLPIVWHGPSAGATACYQWSCVGPALATKHATDDLAWAQSRPKSMLPMNSHASVKVGGVPQCSGEVEHCGMLGTPAPFQSSVEWCGTAWNGCALTTPVTPCHHRLLPKRMIPTFRAALARPHFINTKRLCWGAP